jgi:glycosyltransferase involved in cell wall biosynthesis
MGKLIMAIRVMYDHQVFQMQKYGGISRYFYQLITRLVAAEEIRISLFMGLYTNKYGLNHFRDQFENYFGWERKFLPKGKKLGPWLNDKMFSYFIQRSPSNLYHQTYYAPYETAGIKRIVTVHDMVHELYPQYFSPNDPVFFNKKQSVAMAEGVICVSECTKKDLIKLFNVPETKIAVIYHGTSLQVPAQINPPLPGPYLLYVGDRGGYKNFGLVLQALSALPRVAKEFKLVCFGGGKPHRKHWEEVAAANLTERVIFTSGPDEMLATFYKYAAVFIYPSLYEGFGFPPLEAMHYGCPVLVSNSSSIPEVVGEAGLYFDPTSIADFGDKLEMILSDTALQAKLKQVGRTQEQKFTWDQCARETWSFYHQIAQSQ